MLRTLALAAGAAALGVIAVAAGGAAGARPGPSPQAAPQVTSRAPASSAPAGHPEEGHGLPFHGLLGASEAETRSRLGAPDLARAEGSGAMWTYRLPDCALFVFFKSSAGQPLKLSGAASGPRVRGRSPLPVSPCVAEALQRQAAASPARPQP